MVGIIINFLYYKIANTARVSPQVKQIMKTGEAETMRNKHCGCKPAVVYCFRHYFSLLYRKFGQFKVVSGILIQQPLLQ